MKTYFQITRPLERAALAKACGTSAEYLYLVARGDRKAGPALSKKLVAAEPRLTLHELRPDVWAGSQAAGESTPSSTQAGA